MHFSQKLRSAALLLTLFTLFAAHAFGQSDAGYTITGVVADSLTGATDTYSTVRLMPEGKKDVVAVAAAGADGRFNLSYGKAGNYTLEVAALGRQSLMRRVTLGGAKTVDLGRILTQEATATLGEATVLGAKPLVKAEIDRLSYAIADDPDAQSNSLLDMLRKVPLVTVDGQDNISVNGSSSFKVYVNGKPNKMMSDNPSIVLKSFPANAVKRVEVITDPGAKYDAEGTSGILNIVTETDAETSGWTLSPNIRAGNKDLGGNLFGMVQIGKLTLSANGGVHRMLSQETDVDTERETFGDATNHLLTGRSDGRQHGTFGFGGVDASYDFTKHDLLTASMQFFRGRQRSNSEGHTQMDGDQGTVYAFDTRSRSLSKMGSINASVDYQHLFAKEDQSLTFSYRFSGGHNEQASDNTYGALQNVPYALTDLSVDPNNKSREHTAQVDFTTPIGKHHTLSLGAKYIYRLNRSDNDERIRAAGTEDEFVKSDSLSLLYRHRNDIAAGYAEYLYKIKKFSLRAGLRFESSHIRVTYPDGSRDAFSTTLNDWVPSLNLAYNITDVQMLRASYNMRIGRPGIDYLSPYVNHTDPTSISYGDPNLTSERAHNVGLNYSFFSQKFSLNVAAEYAFSTNGLTRYSFLQDGILNTTSSNSLHTKFISANAYVNWLVVKGTTFTANAGLSYGDYKSYRTGNHNHGYSGSVFAMLRQDLPWKLKLGLGGGNQWPNVSLQGEGSSFYFYFGSLSRSFLKEDRLTVELSTFCPFSPNRTFSTTTETTAFRSTTAAHIHGMARFSIGLRWRLGKLQASVKKAAHTIENNDVQGGSTQQQSQMSGLQGATTGTGN